MQGFQKLCYGVFWAALGLSGTAVIASDTPLDCGAVGVAQQLCKLAATTLLPKQDFQAEVRISYDFACHSNANGLSFASEAGSAAVADGGSGAAPVDLIGYGPFEIKDTAPDKTYRATFIGECVIHVTNLDVKPSPFQLFDWRERASNLARIINDDIERYKLAKTLASIVQWDDEQLNATLTHVEEKLQAELPSDLPYDSLVYPVPCANAGKCGQLKDAADMPAAWTLAVISNPDLPDLVAMKAQIVSIKAGRPAYDQTTADTLKTQLGNDVEEATGIIANGDKWINVIDADMKAIVAKLKGLKSKASNV